MESSVIREHAENNGQMDKGLMKIGFDVSQAGRTKAGCGFFADGLIRSLLSQDRSNNYLLYENFGDFYFDGTVKKHLKLSGSNFDWHSGSGGPGEAVEFWGRPIEDIERDLGGPEILHCNNFFCPAEHGASLIVYTLYDVHFLEHPEWGTEANRIGCFRGVFNASLYADWIVAISEYSKEHYLRFFPHFPEERISVCYPGNRYMGVEQDVRPGPTLSDLSGADFWLSVGTLEPRKNQKNLIRAYSQLVHRGVLDAPLVLVGGIGWMMDDLSDFLREEGVEDKVRITGYVSEAQLLWLYRNCFGLVYPSLFEGFGLPVLEAMSQGVPVITSNVSSIPEVAGKACLLVDPNEVNSIRDGMERLLTNKELRTEMQKKSIEQARIFTWAQTGADVLASYQKVAEMGPR